MLKDGFVPGLSFVALYWQQFTLLFQAFTIYIVINVHKVYEILHNLLYLNICFIHSNILDSFPSFMVINEKAALIFNKIFFKCAKMSIFP